MIRPAMRRLRQGGDCGTKRRGVLIRQKGPRRAGVPFTVGSGWLPGGAARIRSGSCGGPRCARAQHWIQNNVAGCLFAGAKASNGHGERPRLLRKRSSPISVATALVGRGDRKWMSRVTVDIHPWGPLTPTSKSAWNKPHIYSMQASRPSRDLTLVVVVVLLPVLLTLCLLTICSLTHPIR